jgi:hypothetical protein
VSNRLNAELVGTFWLVGAVLGAQVYGAIGGEEQIAPR